MGKIISAGYRGGGREREGVEWVVREGVGAGGEMTQALYAHMNNKTIKILKKVCATIAV
jgi:NaMN:DMB phosphoribosyltransferase